MSAESERVVREVLQEREGNDVLPAIRETLATIDTGVHADTAATAALSSVAGWRHYADDIEWDMTGVGVPGVAHGLHELALWSAAWAAAFTTYVYRVKDYRDLGDWVLTSSDVEATMIGGSPVTQRVAQLWKVRDGKVTTMRAFRTEDEALAHA
jgi:ketosteroid isomerase-like protein